MSARPARHLALVDTDTGEVVESRELADMQRELDELKTKFKMAQRDVAAKNLRIANLEADHARKRLDHDRYGDACRVARYWWKKCRAGNNRVHYLSPDRIDAVLALMDQEELVPVKGKRRRERRPKYTMADFKMAVDGCHFDHFVSKRRNGSDQHHDDLELICRTSAKFEEYVARCPYPREVAESALMRDNPGQGSNVPPDPGGDGRRVQHVEVTMGGARWRVPSGQQEGWLFVRGRLGHGDPGEPSAV